MLQGNKIDCEDEVKLLGVIISDMENIAISIIVGTSSLIIFLCSSIRLTQLIPQG